MLKLFFLEEFLSQILTDNFHVCQANIKLRALIVYSCKSHDEIYDLHLL